jgi:hypothetical protein
MIDKVASLIPTSVGKLDVFKSKVKRNLLQSPYEHFLPVDHKLEDIFLVSFPKSGNTWLRFLVANAIKVKFNIDRQVNFFSIHDIIPDIQISRNICSHGPFGRQNIPRIIKSHSTYNPYYHRVILLVRDPRDALISYYYFMMNYDKVSSDSSLSQFVRSPKYGAQAWVTHTKSWLFTKNSSQNIQLLLYEELLSNPHEQLCKVMDLIGFNLTDSELDQAVMLSSKENMKQSELHHKSTYSVKTQKTAFVRQGKATAGKELATEDRQYIEELTRSIAEKVGYQF